MSHFTISNTANDYRWDNAAAGFGFSTTDSTPPIAKGFSTTGQDSVGIAYISDIPQGATIVSAILTITPGSTDSSTTCNVKYYFQLTNSAVAATTSATAKAIAAAGTIAQTNDTNVAGWTINVAVTVNVTTSLQEVVNQALYVSGNGIGLVVVGQNGSTGKRANTDFSGGAAKAMVLDVTYTSGGVVYRRKTLLGVGP